MTDNFLPQSFSPCNLTRENLYYSGYATHDPAQARCHTLDHCSLHRSLFRFRSEFPMHNLSGWYHLALNHLTHNIRQMFNLSRIISQAHQPLRGYLDFPVSACSLLTNQAAVRSHKILPSVSQGYFPRNLSRAWTKPLHRLRHA